MSSLFQVFIGIDIGFGPRPVTFVALDNEQQALAISAGDVPDALAYAAGQQAGALVAINAAALPNRGRMRRAEVRKGLSPVPEKGRSTHMRQVEYELEQAGFHVTVTASDPERSMPWVRRGFNLVERLQALGYQAFPAEADGQPCPRQWLETNGDAAFQSLLDVTPLPSGTLEGRIQRQLALRDEDLDVPDAMEFFEEVTRFKILKSNLPTKDLFPQAELDAWMAAHTAWLLANEPRLIRRFGEPEEGQVFLPQKAPE